VKPVIIYICLNPGFNGKFDTNLWNFKNCIIIIYNIIDHILKL